VKFLVKSKFNKCSLSLSFLASATTSNKNRKDFQQPRKIIHPSIIKFIYHKNRFASLKSDLWASRAGNSFCFNLNSQFFFSRPRNFCVRRRKISFLVCLMFKVRISKAHKNGLAQGKKHYAKGEFFVGVI
jgi:hypothetical protein